MNCVTAAPPRPIGSIGLAPPIILALWAAAIVWLTDAGAFVDTSTSLPLRLMPAVIVPPALFLLAYWMSPTVRAWVAQLDLAMVVGVQTFRVIGIVFLFEWAQGRAPLVFAAPAGLGDIAVGLLALGVTLRVARQPLGQESAIRTLAIAGFVDFAAAFTFATLASRGMPLASDNSTLPLAAQTLPISLIPTFGVPLFMIAHIVALLKLSEPSRREDRVSTR